MTTPTGESPDAAALLALEEAEHGSLEAALSALTELARVHPDHPDVADAWAAVGDLDRARGDDGVTVLQAMVPVARSWTDPRGRSTLFMALAELEALHREPSWAAHWLRKAMAADPTDARPWDLCEVMLDTWPDLPVGRATKEALKQLKQAVGELPVKDDDFAGATVDLWEQPAE